MPALELNPQGLAWLAALERVLQEIAQTNAALLAALESKREALRQARVDAIAAAMEQERPLVDRLSQLDGQRAELMTRLAKMIRPGARLKLSELAAALGGAAGERLKASADQMRAQLLEVRQRSKVLGGAMEQLSRHVSGVMQSVGAAMNAAGVYGRQGRVHVGAAQQFAVDIKS